MSPVDDIEIGTIDAAEATRRIDELVAILRDSVEGGASMNFLDGVTDEELADFWRDVISDIEAGGRVLIVADMAGVVVGTAMLIDAPQQNARHRAEVGKMIVHCSARRQRIGVGLLEAVEAIARERGRTLLLLDTETDSAGERLYAACGWTSYGVVPDHACSPGGIPKPTTFFYKQLAP